MAVARCCSLTVENTLWNPCDSFAVTVSCLLFQKTKLQEDKKGTQGHSQLVGKPDGDVKIP